MLLSEQQGGLRTGDPFLPKYHLLAWPARPAGLLTGPWHADPEAGHRIPNYSPCNAPLSSEMEPIGEENFCPAGPSTAGTEAL